MKTLQQSALEMGFDLTPFQLEQFEIYYQELIAWNKKFNLTRITEPEEVAAKHFLDSLSCFAAIPQLPQRVIDIGTGAGFPGVVLKIARPKIQLTLVESTGKKAVFLNHLVSKLELREVTALHSRAETTGHHPDHRGSYDLAVARAVAPLRVLAEYMLPLLKKGGLMLAQKGANPAAELATAANSLGILGGKHQKTMSVAIPNLNAARHLVLIKKVKATPVQYPRKPGMPDKKPIS